MAVGVSSETELKSWVKAIDRYRCIPNMMLEVGTGCNRAVNGPWCSSQQLVSESFFHYPLSRYIWTRFDHGDVRSTGEKPKNFSEIAEKVSAPDIEAAEGDADGRRISPEVGQLTRCYPKMADSGCLLMIRYVTPVRLGGLSPVIREGALIYREQTDVNSLIKLDVTAEPCRTSNDQGSSK